MFHDQMTRSGFFMHLMEHCDVVFIDAPYPASGPLPPDVKRLGSASKHLEWFTVEQQGDQIVFDEDKLAG